MDIGWSYMALPDVISEELKSGEGRGKSELKEGEWGRDGSKICRGS